LQLSDRTCRTLSLSFSLDGCVAQQENSRVSAYERNLEISSMNRDRESSAEIKIAERGSNDEERASEIYPSLPGCCCSSSLILVHPRSIRDSVDKECRAIIAKVVRFLRIIERKVQRILRTIIRGEIEPLSKRLRRSTEDIVGNGERKEEADIRAGPPRRR